MSTKKLAKNWFLGVHLGRCSSGSVHSYIGGHALVLSGVHGHPMISLLCTYLDNRIDPSKLIHLCGLMEVLFVIGYNTLFTHTTITYQGMGLNILVLDCCCKLFIAAVLAVTHVKCLFCLSNIHKRSVNLSNMVKLNVSLTGLYSIIL